MKIINSGEVLSTDSYVIEKDSEEMKKIQAALTLYSDLENGNFKRKLSQKMEKLYPSEVEVWNFSLQLYKMVDM